MACFEAILVNAGIDSLVIGFDVAKYSENADFLILENAKIAAGAKLFGSKGVGITWFGRPFAVLAKGTRGYEWVLENNDLGVCIARTAKAGRVFPEVYITFRAEYLWRLSPEAAFAEVDSWLKSWAVVLKNKVSRCDLCMDLQMPFPKLDYKRELVTRAKRKVDYSVAAYAYGCRGSGYEVGKGMLVGRIYDKLLEITKSLKDWFKDIWLFNGWDGTTSVIRVEFQARRGLLKEYSINSFENLVNGLADLWRYFTCDWLTVRNATEDKNRNRWPIASWWREVQKQRMMFGEPLGILRYKQPKLRFEHLLKQAQGVSITAMAVSANSLGLEHALFSFKRDWLDWLESDELKTQVKNRMAQVGSMSPAPKTHLLDAAVRLGGVIESVEALD